MSEELIRFELKNRPSAGCLGRCKERIYSGPYFFGIGIKDIFFLKIGIQKNFSKPVAGMDFLCRTAAPLAQTDDKGTRGNCREAQQAAPLERLSQAIDLAARRA